MIICTMLISTLVFSQAIGKVQHIELNLLDGTYTITYNDYKFTQIDDYKSISFTDIDALYNQIMKGLEDMPEQDIEYNLPDDTLWLHFEKNLGVKSFQFMHAVNNNPKVIGLSRYLTKKQVNKLFGKN